MDKITFEEYKNAIKAQYETKKTDGFYGSGDISNLTPAQLRDLCLRISENGLSKTDESTFRLFFRAKDHEKLGRAIDNFGTGKLKSVISFLKGVKNSENPTRIELASIIVDFNPRPFNRYKQNGGVENITALEISPAEEQKGMISDTDDLEAFSEDKTSIEKKNTIKKIAAYLLVLFFVCYTIKDLSFPTKECMQWEKDHYEAVDCTTEDPSVVIIPIDENSMKLKKLDSKVALVFFKNDKAIVWYSKTDGVIELFNQSGFHPETEKPLKPITDYIIRKHKLKEK
jgi:hypothetical protein